MSTVVVFGGSGFVGRCLVVQLVAAGHHVIVPTRRREAVKGDLIVLPNTDVVACDPFEPRSLAKLADRADVVINLVGILHENRRHSFEKVHVEYVRRLVDAITNSESVRQLIHVSALNAASGAPSRYLRSKGKGEAMVGDLQRCPWTVIRPSVVFGAGDGFFGLFSKLLRFVPVMGLPMPDARLQPIWVGDLVTMIVACIGRPAATGERLAAAGPEIHSMAQLLGMLMEHKGPRRPLLRLGPALSRMLATVFEMVPFMLPLLTRDNLASLSVPSVCEKVANEAVNLVPHRLTSPREYLLASQSDKTHPQIYNDFRHVARRG